LKTAYLVQEELCFYKLGLVALLYLQLVLTALFSAEIQPIMVEEIYSQMQRIFQLALGVFLQIRLQQSIMEIQLPQVRVLGHPLPLHILEHSVACLV
jgi:hypothetical protein